MVADAVLEVSVEQRRIVVDAGFLGVQPEPEPPAGHEDPGAGADPHRG
jgi:hypothetical protein